MRVWNTLSISSDRDFETVRSVTDLCVPVVILIMSRALKLVALVALLVVAYKLLASDSAVEVEYEAE